MTTIERDAMVERREPPVTTLGTAQVVSMAVICLVLGLALGYLFRGSQTQPVAAPVATVATMPSSQTAPVGPAHPTPTLDQMKRMADKKAEPLLAQFKNDPNNAHLLIQIAQIYESTHQFKEAASYFAKSLQLNPRDVATRTEMASCLYYDGDVNGAIAQLKQGLQDQPNDVNALFNLGMIEWREKKDSTGAVSAWRKLLKSNPTLEDAKKTQVQKLISEASQPRLAN